MSDLLHLPSSWWGIKQKKQIRRKKGVLENYKYKKKRQLRNGKEDFGKEGST